MKKANWCQKLFVFLNMHKVIPDRPCARDGYKAYRKERTNTQCDIFGKEMKGNAKLPRRASKITEMNHIIMNREDVS
jgi:hypothetical protein